jgi:broad specificity phosphatase PhoE
MNSTPFKRIILPIVQSPKSLRALSTYYAEQQPRKKVTQRPKRIILIRHGESLGNIDDSAYVTTPDWRVPLTEKGKMQSNEAGKELSKIIGKDGKVFFYYSPYRRTRETLEELKQHISKEQIISIREEPRISEQQFGNFQNVEEVWESKRERHEFGRFYYRFQSGEAGLDVYSRVSSFISTLVRDCQQYQKAGYDLDNINVVIITHGLSLRLFLMRWFQVRK